jgi:hypothetical protein
MMPRKKATRREPTPKEAGQEILEAASKAGADYASDQINGSYFRDWVWEQMVEAEEMRKCDPSSVLPLETPSDAKKLARNMLQQLEWDTKRDMEQPTVLELSGAKGVFNIGSADWVRDHYGITYEEVSDAFFSAFDEELKSPSIRQWLSDMILEMDEEVRGVRKSKLVEETRANRRKSTGETWAEAPKGDPPYFGEMGHWGYAIKIDGIENDFPQLPPGRQIDALAAVKQFKTTAKSEWLSTKHRKGQRPLTEIKRWIKAVQPSQFYARWPTDVDDDSVQIWYTGAETHLPVSPGRIEERRPVVRDYIAVDPKGRTIAGPFTSYSDAKREATRAHGYVRFASGARDRRR